MEFKAFLIKYAEIGIKGNNRRFFEDALVRQMKYALKPVGDFSIRKESGRIFVHANEEYDFDEAVKLKPCIRYCRYLSNCSRRR